MATFCFGAVDNYGGLWAWCGHKHRSREAAEKCASRNSTCMNGTAQIAIRADGLAINAATYVPAGSTTRQPPSAFTADKKVAL